MTARKETYSEKELEELQELEHKVASARILGEYYVKLTEWIFDGKDYMEFKYLDGLVV